MLQRIYYFIFFKVLRWRMIGELPKDIDKYLFVGLPHTSNWDFIYGWVASRALGVKLTFFVKDVFCRGPLICFCRYFGASPVNRRKRTNFVDSVAEQFSKTDKMVVLLTPEGTRKYTPTLKSGYYYIAKSANVPIVLVGPNYRDKIITFLPPRAAMATFEEDQADLIEFSKNMHGKHPKSSYT
ncbi:MAG: 1-acyl-sn-glycerol-3-phosphate acyltransferase [Acidiferrobacterales bacterium]|nr:1-acyl-sn-glycerol-3-phosphate acyltransferase [Acidiferrobacterales bacterium]